MNKKEKKHEEKENQKKEHEWLVNDTRVSFTQRLYQESGNILNWSLWLHTFRDFNSFMITAKAIKKNKISLLVNTSDVNDDITYGSFQNELHTYGVDSNYYLNKLNTTYGSVIGSKYTPNQDILNQSFDNVFGNNAYAPNQSYRGYVNDVKQEMERHDDVDIRDEDALSARELLDKINNTTYTLKTSQFIIEKAELNIKKRGGMKNKASGKNNSIDHENTVYTSIIDSFNISTKLIDFEKLMWNPYILKIYVPYIAQDSDFGSSIKKYDFFPMEINPAAIQFINNVEDVEKATEVVFNVELTQDVINELRNKLVISKGTYRKLTKKLKHLRKMYGSLNSVGEYSSIIRNPSLIIHISQNQITDGKNPDIFGTTKVETKMYVHWYDNLNSNEADYMINKEIVEEQKREEEEQEREEARNPLGIGKLMDINEPYKNEDGLSEGEEVDSDDYEENEMDGVFESGHQGITINRIHKSKALSAHFFTDRIDTTADIFLDYIPIFKYSLNSTVKDYNDLSFRIEEAFNLFLERASLISRMDAETNRSSAVTMFGLTNGIHPVDSAKLSSSYDDDDFVEVVSIAGTGIKDFVNNGRILTSSVYIEHRNLLQQALMDVETKIDTALGYNVITIQDLGSQQPESHIRVGYNLLLPFVKELSLVYLKEIIFQKLIRGNTEENKVITTLNTTKHGTRNHGFKSVIEVFHVLFDTTVILGDTIERIKQQQVETIKASSSNGQDAQSNQQTVQQMQQASTQGRLKKQQ